MKKQKKSEMEDRDNHRKTKFPQLPSKYKNTSSPDTEWKKRYRTRHSKSPGIGNFEEKKPTQTS